MQTYQEAMMRKSQFMAMMLMLMHENAGTVNLLHFHKSS